MVSSSSSSALDPSYSSSASLDGTSVRRKLSNFTTWEHVVEALKKSKKIIIVTGAGISVSSGIPDFRSKDTGLYNTLDCSKFNIPSAELLFDYEFFKIDPSPFYAFSSALNISKENLLPSPSHKFIYMLEQKKKLLRNYTQNVDGLEKSMGICKVIECHGSMEKFRCLSEKCNYSRKLVDIQEELNAGLVCYCKCGDILKPDITFFGEPLPRNFFAALEKDVDKADLVLVVGTSLKVGGSVHEVLKNVNPCVPQVLINRDLVEPPATFSEGFDVSLLGNCDDIFNQLCESLGWDLPAVSFTTNLKKNYSSTTKQKASEKGKYLITKNHKRSRNEEVMSNKISKTKSKPSELSKEVETKSRIRLTRSSKRLLTAQKEHKPSTSNEIDRPLKRSSVRLAKVSMTNRDKSQPQNKGVKAENSKGMKRGSLKVDEEAVAGTVEIQHTADRVYRLFLSQV